MLRPIILLGCGGSGQKAVRYVRDSVRRQLEHNGWTTGVPRAWQFLAFDTLDLQESPGEIPTIPNKDYTSIALSFKDYQSLEGALLAQFPKSSKGYRELMGWRPLAQEVNVPLKLGAGQIRAVGRAAGILGFQSVVRPKLQHAFTECTTGLPELERLSMHLGIQVPLGGEPPDPLVVVLGSMAGGTGAGIMLDMIDLVRRTNSAGQFPVAIVFSADIFGQKTNSSMAANGLAFMSELMSAYWDSEVSGTELIPTSVPTNNRGPHAVFVVGRKNLDGIDLKDSKNVYRAVGEALAAWVMSVPVQEAVQNFSITNWDKKANQNMGGFPFAQDSQRGIISSLGSSTISIGRERFREYAEKLLVREMVAFLDAGHLAMKNDYFGAAAENMTPPSILQGIVRKERDEFLRACGVSERGTTENQITDVFRSDDQGKAERQQIRNDILKQLGDGTRDPKDWKKALSSQFELARRQSVDRANRNFQLKVTEWGPSVFDRILRTSSEYAARFGLAVTIELIRFAQSELHEVAAEVRQEGREALNKAQMKFGEYSKDALPDQKGKLQVASEAVQSGLNLLLGSAINDWIDTTSQRIAKAMEDLADQVFAPIASSMEQARQRVHHMMVGAGDGDAPVTDSWPVDNGSVPANYAPSPVEFFLEDHRTWPDKLKDLIRKSLGDPDPLRGVPFDPVKAARFLMIADEYSGEREREVIHPLIWAADGQLKPNWAPGATTQVKIGVSEEELFSRVRAWMKRPGTALDAFCAQGLQKYLDVQVDGMPVPDHFDRLSRFRQKMAEALNQSKPLIEIDVTLNSRVHPNPVDYTPIVQGFPFGTGHPARAVAEEILRPYFDDGDTLERFFVAGDTESVLVSSLLSYPVHPCVVKSFTSPVNDALTMMKSNPALMRGSFWQWARTKVLEDAIPLPDEVRRSMIRGFAVGRLLGYVTADPSEQIRIGGDDGIHHMFPAILLTETSAENLLPALLESFVLTFADAPTQGERAFEAYRQLHILGSTPGTFAARGDLLSFIMKGTLNESRVVDPLRSEAMQGQTVQERVSKLVENLEANLKRYRNLENYSPSGDEYRTSSGKVVPENTMSLEILHDLIAGYEGVKAAVELAATGVSSV